MNVTEANLARTCLKCGRPDAIPLLTRDARPIRACAECLRGIETGDPWDGATERALLACEGGQVAEDEAKRWQDRIAATIARHGLTPFDASGNESGDPLDWTDGQVSHALGVQQDAIAALRAQVAELAGALGGVLAFAEAAYVEHYEQDFPTDEGEAIEHALELARAALAKVTS